MLSRARDGRRPVGEQGAILVFTAIMLLMLVAFAALAVDLSNAWSNSQLSQTNADVAASGALFRIPRTYLLAGAPGDLVGDAVQDEADNLVSLNVDPGVTANATATVGFVPNGADVTVDVTIDSENAFARAIGAGSEVAVDSTATAHVEVPPVDKLFPVGFYAPYVTGQPASSSQPYQCINVDAAAGPESPRVCGSRDGSPPDADFNGLRNRLLGMTQLNADPPDCTVDTASNFINGVDHIVDTRDEGVRTEANACAFGHLLTLPSAADPVFLPGLSTELDDALIGPGAPLQNPSSPLWTFLDPGASGQCDPSLFAALTVLEDLSNQMRACLRGWNGSSTLFVSGVISSPRFGWGIDIEENGLTPEEFEAPILVFLNTLVPDVGPLDDPATAQYLDGSTFPAPPVHVGGLTMFSVAPRMLSSSDRAALDSPFYDVDMLDLTLTN